MGTIRHTEVAVKVIKKVPTTQKTMLITSIHFAGPSKVAFIEGWPHLRGGLYEGFHCNKYLTFLTFTS